MRSLFFAPGVIGLRISKKKIVCQDCWTETEWDNSKEDDFITESELVEEEKVYICERCNMRLVSFWDMRGRWLQELKKVHDTLTNLKKG